jgi:SAM-dependent methyltransferase
VTASSADRHFFDDAYHRLLAPFHPESEARLETAALRELLGLAQGDRLLDLACGWGRHLRLLRDAGHDVVGVDLSVALLRHASAADSAADSPSGAAPLVAADMLRLPFATGVFDVVLNLATSLGLFLEDERALIALREARRVLRPGGRLLIEGMNGEDAIAEYAHRDGWTLGDGTEVRVRRRLDEGRRVSHEVLRWRGPAGAGTKRHSLRLRSGPEVARLVADAGLELEATYGDWDLEELGPQSERVIIIARR